MARPQKLAGAERAAALAALAATGWQHDAETDRLQRSFRFQDFAEAWGFLSRVALLAERIDHHPDWSNSWNRVDISLTTHDAKGLTELDLRLAQGIDRLIAA